MPTSYSCGLPHLPGFDRPVSLKQYLENTLQAVVCIRCTNSTTAPSAIPVPSAPDRGVERRYSGPIITLPATLCFSASVYAPAGLIHHHTVLIESETSLSSGGTSEVRRTRAREKLALKVRKLRPYCPLTAAVLGHPVWEALLSQVPEATSDFLESSCITVVQFEPGGGGLLVLGPLSQLSNRLETARKTSLDPWSNSVCTCNDSMRVLRGPWKRKRCCAQQTACDVATSASSRGEILSIDTNPTVLRETTAAEQRFGIKTDFLAVHGTPLVLRNLCHVVAPTKRRPLASSLARLNTEFIPRSVLLSPSTRYASRRDRRVAERGVLMWRDEQQRIHDLRLTMKKNSLNAEHNLRHEGDPSARTVSDTLHGQGLAPLVLVHLVFPFLRCNERSAGQKSSDATQDSLDGALHTTFLIHLQHVLGCLVGNAVACDVRGAAIKHFGSFEDRGEKIKRGVYKRARDGTAVLRFPQSQALTLTWSLREISVPPAVVASFLATLLSSFLWSAYNAGASEKAMRGADGVRSTNTPCKRSSFWGSSPEHSAAVVATISGYFDQWLSLESSSEFPLSRCLFRVKVSGIPWLNALYTVPANGRGRKQRSAVQQQVFLCVMRYVFMVLAPAFIAEALHVAESPGSKGCLYFLPIKAWRRMLQHEVDSRISISQHDGRTERKTVSSPPSLIFNDAVTPSHLCVSRPMGLRRVKVNNVTAIGSPSQRHLLSLIRLLPDGEKIRPISVLRWMHSASLVRMATHPSRSRWTFGQSTRNSVGHGPSCNCVSNTAHRSSRGGQPRKRKMEVLRSFWLGEDVANGSSTRRSDLSKKKNPLWCALQCLVSGWEWRQREAGRCGKVYDRSTVDDYKELLAFAQDVRAAKRMRKLDAVIKNPNVEGATCEPLRNGFEDGSASAPSHTESGVREPLGVTLVRGDASRCYDRLSQAAVLSAIDALLAELLHPKKNSVAQSTDAHFVFQRFTALQSIAVPRRTLGGSCWQLQQRSWFRPLSTAMLTSGAPYLAIPGGWTYRECGNDPHLLDCDRQISIEEIRSVLLSHTQRHLVSLAHAKGVHLFHQHIGITQGSSVAMLLCNAVLEKVDETLHEILVGHEEVSLVLRRVDDVLVATSSPIAALRCYDQLQCGWPSDGFHCHAAKLNFSEASHPVPWCGLLLWPVTFTVSIDWSRIVQMVRLTAASWRGERDSLLHTHRLLRILGLRAPLTVFCTTLNSCERVQQTLAEIIVVWARVLVTAIRYGRVHHTCRPHLRCILLPRRYAVYYLSRLLSNRNTQLGRYGSSCYLLHPDENLHATVNIFILYVLHQTLRQTMLHYRGANKHLQGAGECAFVRSLATATKSWLCAAVKDSSEGIQIHESARRACNTALDAVGHYTAGIC